MEFFEVVQKRGSYRGKFKKERIPEEDLLKIVKAGIAAPSGYNMQTTHFIVVTNNSLRLEISRIIPTPATRTAQAFIVPVSESWTAENGMCFESEDYGAAVENVMLAITALGYAGVWIDGQTRYEDVTEKLEDLLEIPSGQYLRAIIPIGIPEEEVVQKEKMDVQERVTFLK